MIDLSQETEALIRRLAIAENVSADTVVRQALDARLRMGCGTVQPDQPEAARARTIAERRACMEQIAREIAALPVLDTRSPREIMDDLDAA
ncbi:MAG: hypothetical protein AB7F35_12780 [Acetobacteraceae bacterium]